MEALVDLMPLASMLLFVGIFAVVLFYVLTDRRRDHNDKMGAAALDDGHIQDGGSHRG